MISKSQANLIKYIDKGKIKKTKNLKITGKVRVVGIADAHGIESYYEKDAISETRIANMSIRAMSNRQRHAVLYEVDVTPIVHLNITNMLRLGKEIEALTYLKKHSFNLYLKEEQMGNVEASWELIPDPRLDAWR